MIERDHLAGATPLSPPAEDLGAKLAQTPLASAHDSAGIWGRPAGEVYASMGELRHHELVMSVQLGCIMERVDRHILTQRGEDRSWRPLHGWHQPGALSSLLQRPATVEQLYGAVARLLGQLGSVRSFQWLDAKPFDALAGFEAGWVLLRWTGILRSEAAMTEDIMALGPHLSDLRTGLEQPRPTALVFVVIDAWQREAVLRVASRLGIEDWIMVYCMEDGLWRECDMGRGTGMIQQRTYRRSGGLRTFEEHRGNSLWVEPGSQDLFRVLNAILQWPGITIPLLKVILGEGSSGRRAQRAVGKLRKRLLIEGNVKERPRPLRVAPDGMELAALWDRTTPGKGWDRSQMERRLQSGFQGHEAGLLGLLAPFMEAGCPTAAGWRYWELMGEHGGIAPDALVYLADGPLGPGWYFIEYERRASNERDVRAKLRGYASSTRSNRWPLLLVCKDEQLEHLFHRVGAEDKARPRLLMLTTTLDRLAQHGPLGHLQCWSKYGEMVRLG